MRLGFYTDYSRDIAQFAQDTGFTSMELSAWPQSSLNADDDHRRTDQGDPRRPRQPRHPDLGAGLLPQLPHRRQGRSRRIQALLPQGDATRRPDGGPRRLHVRRHDTRAGPSRPAWSPSPSCSPNSVPKLRISASASASRTARCSTTRTAPARTWPSVPEIWKAMFDAVPSRALGLEIDPSHLVFLGIDYIQAIRDFGDRIVHFHAKDIDIDERKRGVLGLLRPGVRRPAGIRQRMVALPCAGLGRHRLAQRHHRTHRSRLRRQHRHRTRGRGVRRRGPVEDRRRSRHRRDARKGAQRTGIGLPPPGADDAAGLRPNFFRTNRGAVVRHQTHHRRRGRRNPCRDRLFRL